MGLYKHLRELWVHGSPEFDSMWRERLIKWRTEPVTLRIERPTRLDRARALGYRAKQGFVLIRQRVLRGGRQREKFKGGRRPKHMRRKKVVDKSYQQVAEERAVKNYPNCEVLNSYYVAKDGIHYWYEVILVDKAHPAILADKRISWIAGKQHTGRVFRGKTSAARKSKIK